LPDPLSPVKRTLASVGPTRSMSRNTSCIASDSPNKGLGAAKGKVDSERLFLTIFIAHFLLNAFV
jgi:hypothetical protein